MEKKATETKQDQIKLEDLSANTDVQGGANGATRITDKNGTVGGMDILPLR